MNIFRLMVPLITLSVMVLIDVYSYYGTLSWFFVKKTKFKTWYKYIYIQISIAMYILVIYLFVKDNPGIKMKAYGGGGVFCFYIGKFVFVLFLFVDDIIRFLRIVYKYFNNKPAIYNSEHQSKNGITRQQFLVTGGALLSLAPVVIFSRGIFRNAHNYRVHRVRIPLKNLPGAFRGMKIVQISDIHSGSFFDADGVSNGVKMIQLLQPDLILFTGDLVNNKADEAIPWMDVLSGIKAPMGVISILGNHDYGEYIPWPDDASKLENMNQLYNIQKDLGWTLLRNEHLTIDLHGQRMGIVGVENWGNQARFQKLGDLEKATRNMPEVPVKILLSHDPSHWDAKVRTETPDMDLTLSGHTHGFQLGIEIPGLKFSPAQWAYKQWAGLYESDRQKLYVNRGFGYIGYPGRVGILPEITLIELV